MRVLGEFHSTIGGLVRRFESTVSFLEGDGVQLFFNEPIEAEVEDTVEVEPVGEFTPRRLPTAGRGLQRRRSSRHGSRADNRRERMNAYRTCAPGCHPEDAAEPTGWRARASSHTAVRAASAAVPASVAG